MPSRDRSAARATGPAQSTVPTMPRLVLGLAQRSASRSSRDDREDERRTACSAVSRGRRASRRSRRVTVVETKPPIRSVNSMPAVGAGGAGAGSSHGQLIVDRPAAVLGDERSTALGERGDRQQRVDAERARDDRPVGDVEPACTRRRPRRRTPGPCGRRRRAAASAPMPQPPSGWTVTRSVAERLGPERVAHGGRRRAAALARRRGCVDSLEDRLSADARPRRRAARSSVELHRAAAARRAPSRGRSACCGPRRGAGRAARLSASRALLGRSLAEPAVGVRIAELAVDRARAAGSAGATVPPGIDALLDHHAVVEVGRVAQVDEPGDAGADRLRVRAAARRCRRRCR